MKNSALISVIVPTLNAIGGIERCLSSIAQQTLRDIEVICVDAGSDDGTIDVIRYFAGQDERFRLILSEQKSYGHQVNLGISEAKGNYIGIVEADDHITSDMYERLYDVAFHENPDWVRADYFEEYVGENGMLQHGQRHLLVNKGLYGKVTDLTNHPECLQPDIVATWSGIYNRAFLERYDIRHNETPGASYQDTGFWTLTHIYAKRGYFVDEAYYNYRIDNPDSSTFSMEKPYCICDELKYVRERIAPGAVKSEITDRLWWLFYRKYKRNIERVDPDILHDYYERFADDLKEWQEKFGSTKRYFYEEESQELSEIIEHHGMYAGIAAERRADFLRRLLDYSEILIYGAGRIGQSLYRQMKNPEAVKGFVTTEMLPEAQDNQPLVVIASKIANYREEMETTAKQRGYENIVRVPYGTIEV